jgi:hypothetical protein
VVVSYWAGSLRQDMPCYSALGLPYALLTAAALQGSPAQMEGAMVAVYVLRSLTWALCGLGFMSCESPHLIYIQACRGAMSPPRDST